MKNNLLNLFAMDATENVRNWFEDFDHENGKYCCKCCSCGNEFVGHKRRVVCKECYVKNLETMNTELRAKNQEIASDFVRFTLIDHPEALAKKDLIIEDLQAQLKTTREKKLIWHYCPECGDVGYKKITNTERMCSSCGQSWFIDSNYIDVVGNNLSRLCTPKLLVAAPQPE